MASHGVNFDSVFTAILSDIEAKVSQGLPAPTEAHLTALLSLFDKNQLPNALKLIDQGAVKCFVGEKSHRTVFQVASATKHGHQDTYTVLPGHFCTCHAFQWSVASRAEQHCCKHQLGARLAHALGRSNRSVVPDDVIFRVLMSGV
ncbi:unnamed protein product [Pedinophyceae sp. YPF-701]|nr:unnamed protein product [Pedinophyceae sp. YPF-701]